MRIDFHTHGKWTKKTEFSLSYFNELIANAREAGLHATALTEHFNTQNFYDVFDILDEHFSYVGDHYDVNGFKVFSGMEIDVKDRGHILFIGPRTSIREIRAQLEPHTEDGNFIRLAELLKISEGHPLLKIGAHPLREGTPLTSHPTEHLGQLDAFDLNGRDLFRKGVEQAQTEVYAFVEALNKPVVCGSDTHLPIQYGAVYNDIHISCDTALELKAAIEKNAYTKGISPVLQTKVGAAEVMKEVWKQQKNKDSILSV
ncbi:PHP-associated domain-containing protein [Alkalicoccobacillus murimartini]|uniref:DNA polymerase III alpha subunit (Gram-positive type) n=1 Tax=Alkalicoccobacillus murimartini TaxID=171685 RepID=A0ABT9YIN6_9BACI|nr:PHP-associated domain-containing protein [Alkalicoccobacillus murimartini]MDQ0207391.1 DNA polymerase III alpha subunit (gram-positive type) [Alkalicoccobacillus murimartini]